MSHLDDTPSSALCESVTLVVGTRPEIIKTAGVIHELGSLAQVVHTGQHYDDSMSAVFWSDYRLPAPALIMNGIGGMPRPVQMASIMNGLVEEFQRNRPALVVVQGDTNTAAAGAQAAYLCGIPVAHIEAGLRSRDRAMPEEINRRLVGVVADRHYAPTAEAASNLLCEGVETDRIRITGNTVVEATYATLPEQQQRYKLLADFGLTPGEFILATIHRPENTDHPERLTDVLEALGGLPLPVVFPMHPRTRSAIDRHDLHPLPRQLRVVEPLAHPQFLALAAEARLLISDSGGLQEETTVLKRPLVVVRQSTERPEAFDAGFAKLATNALQLERWAHTLLGDSLLMETLAHTPSPYGDGSASKRIAADLRQLVAQSGSRRPVVIHPQARPTHAAHHEPA